MLRSRTIYQTSRNFSTMTTACITKPYVGLSDLVSRQRSLRVVLDLDKPSSNALSRKELYQLYNLSYLRVPENEEELANIQKSIAEFTAWLSSLSTINTEGYEAVYSPIDYLSKSVGYVISSHDDPLFSDTLAISPENATLKLRKDEVTEGNVAKTILQSAKTVEMNYYVVPASSNGDEVFICGYDLGSVLTSVCDIRWELFVITDGTTSKTCIY